MSTELTPQIAAPALDAPVTEPAQAAEPAPQQPPAGAPEQTFNASYVKQLRDEAAASRVKLKAFEDAQKTELQRATDDAETARKEAAEARASEARFRVAMAHGISEEYLDLLTGSSEDELTAQAAKLSALITPQAQDAPKAPLVPASAGGLTPPAGVVPIQDMIAAATASGDNALVGALKAQMLGNN